ncbi:MAG: excinuclease ABC subunit UvrC [Anaerolineae bacterium]|nr:excinuclease ABC subunit UvrC [Candidatus Roseilinea sp.]MDW8451317.1 excinuclease ABC subunit UvrC [Anaerolineae bacterium]
MAKIEHVSVPEHLEATVKNLPALPGCYLFYDSRGEVIYVGKAVNLRSRVRSYFNPNTWAAYPKTGRMVKEIARIEFVVRGSDLEALIQEAELIKKHRPRYNIRLKDDKRYPYLKVTWQDDFPTVTVTRRIERDGARYYGPYSSAKAVYATRDALRRMFPFLNCDRVITGHDTRACMYYDIKLCSGPCIGAISRAEYRANIQRLCDFLEGKSEQVIADVRARMERAANAYQFEKAAEYRDQLKALEHVIEKQRIVSSAGTDQDVIAFARDEGETCVQVLFIRGGKLLGQEYFVLDGAEGEDDQSVLDAFLKRFYDEAAYVPPEVLLPEQVEEANIIENWLKQKRGTAVKIRTPQAGADASLIELARQNAQEQLATLKAQWREDSVRQEAVLKELQEALDLPRLPVRIECYDISNTQGAAIVGSMVVFVHGVPKKSDYRRFNIKGIAGPNDFESLRQMLRRRFQRWKDSQLGVRDQGAGISELAPEPRPLAPGRKEDPTWALLPDLVIIDGGKGQLGVAVEVLREFDLAHIVPVVSLAKQNEEIFMPGKADAILLPRNAQSFFLVQRIRDEAHRFGLTGHRRQREKIGLASQLDALQGVGPARRKKLLTTFGSIEAIRAASVEELAKVVPRPVAEAIKDGLGE